MDPSDPENPVEPDGPSNPDEPFVPQYPIVPTEPIEPDQPQDPEMPAEITAKQASIDAVNRIPAQNTAIIPQTGDSVAVEALGLIAILALSTAVSCWIIRRKDHAE